MVAREIVSGTQEESIKSSRQKRQENYLIRTIVNEIYFLLRLNFIKKQFHI
jgi:hypothetical protein